MSCHITFSTRAALCRSRAEPYSKHRDPHSGGSPSHRRTCGAEISNPGPVIKAACAHQQGGGPAPAMRFAGRQWNPGLQKTWTLPWSFPCLDPRASRPSSPTGPRNLGVTFILPHIIPHSSHSLSLSELRSKPCIPRTVGSLLN